MDTEAQHTGSAGALLRIKDAACMLRVSPRTIWRMIAEHQLTAVRIRGPQMWQNWQ
jgi:excisionase family DNA binding protein